MAQRLLLWSILAGIVTHLFPPLALVVLPFMIYTIFRLASALGKTPGNATLWAIGTFIPLLNLILLLVLNQRATATLKEAGIAVGFMGVKSSDLPAPSVNVEDPEASIVLPQQPGSASQAQPNYYYLDADNQPIGPVSLKVIGQLRNSGAISDETLVAAEGDEGWNPLSLIEEAS